MKIIRKLSIIISALIVSATIGHTLASSEKSEISTDFTKPSTSSFEISPTPLTCDLVFLGTRDMGKFSAPPSSLETQSYSLPEATVSKHIDEVRSRLDSGASLTWSTPIESDPNTEPAKKHFKRVMRHYFTASAKKIDISRASVHMITNFNHLQIMIYNAMNSDILDPTEPMVSAAHHKASRAHTPLLRTKSADSLLTSSVVASPISKRCVRALTPKDKLTLFIEIIKGLRGRIFDPKTTDKIAEFFEDKNLIVTNLNTLLIATNSAIPVHSAGTLNPGDLGILVELCDKNIPNLRKDILLVVHNNVARA